MKQEGLDQWRNRIEEEVLNKYKVENSKREVNSGAASQKQEIEKKTERRSLDMKFRFVRRPLAEHA